MTQWRHWPPGAAVALSPLEKIQLGWPRLSVSSSTSAPSTATLSTCSCPCSSGATATSNAARLTVAISLREPQGALPNDTSFATTAIVGSN